MLQTIHAWSYVYKCFLKSCFKKDKYTCSKLYTMHANGRMESKLSFALFNPSKYHIKWKLRRKTIILKNMTKTKLLKNSCILHWNSMAFSSILIHHSQKRLTKKTMSWETFNFITVSVYLHDGLCWYINYDWITN